MDYDYWKNNSVEFWQREIGYQRHLLHSYGNIPIDKIQVCLPSSNDLITWTILSDLLGFSSTFPSNRWWRNFHGVANVGDELRLVVDNRPIYGSAHLAVHHGLWSRLRNKTNVRSIDFRTWKNFSFPIIHLTGMSYSSLRRTIPPRFVECPHDWIPQRREWISVQNGRYLFPVSHTSFCYNGALEITTLFILVQTLQNG